MANFTLSPNMNLIIPDVGIESGPQYASDVNNSLTLIDQHNHTPGYGVQVPSGGLDINADLSFQDNNLINARSLRLQPQGSTLSGASDLGCLYETGVDLYYNDGSGNQVRITQNGGVAGTPGSIANLAPPASASYVSADQTFVFQSAANTPANIDGGSFIFRNITANSNGITVSPPSGLSSNYTITLPFLPGSTLPLSISSTGQLSAAQITNVQMAPNSVGTSQLINNSVTQATLALKPLNSTTVVVGGIGVSPSCGAYVQSGGLADQQIPNLTLDITTVGRPVYIAVQADGSTSPSHITFTNTTIDFIITRNGSPIAEFELSDTGPVEMPVNAVTFIDASPAAGTYTYAILLSTTTTALAEVNYASLVVYEI